MDLLKEKILREGHILPGNILKVDSFINHQVDPILMKNIGIEFANYFKAKHITKVVTIESSGIAPAIMTAIALNVPLIIFKKNSTKVLKDDIYQTPITSYTKGLTYELTVSKKYLSPEDNVLIIDDFLANGEAASGAIRLIEQAGATASGIGILIEKTFQPGRKRIEETGIDIYSLARIERFTDDSVIFVEE